MKFRKRRKRNEEPIKIMLRNKIIPPIERDTKKRRHEMCNIYRLAEFNARHREQQRKSLNIKSDIRHTNIRHNQGKQITLCEVPTRIVIKGNEEADKAANNQQICQG